MIFGDSYSDVHTNYENMTFTGENFSGGKSWPLQLIDLHDMYLWNFAYSGARMSSKYTIQTHPCDLETQYGYFKERLLGSEALSDWKGESSIFAFWFGINDIMKSKHSQENTVKEGLGDLFDIISSIYNDGARNILILNVPPFDKSPSVINGGYSDIDQFIDKFNNGILEKLEIFSKDHQDANIILYNVFDEFNYIWDHHKEYGITELVKDYNSYSSRDHATFYWNDNIHPTDKVHKYFTEDLHKYLNNISTHKLENNNSTIKATANFMEPSNAEILYNKAYHMYSVLILYIIYFLFF